VLPVSRSSAPDPGGGHLEVPDVVSGYFDAAAGLPLSPTAIEAWRAASEDGWADPAKVIGPGRRSAVLVEAAREVVAAALNARPDEVTFCTSNEQALHLAVLGTVHGRARVGPVLVHSAVEHSAVGRAAEWHRNRRGEVAIAGVDRLGRVDEDAFVELCSRPGVAAAALQAANHEVGTRQPIARVATELHRLGVPLIVDASQELLYSDVAEPVWASADVVTADAKLWGGPTGMAVLVVRSGTRWITPFPATAEAPATTRLRLDGGIDVPTAVSAAAALRDFRAQAQTQRERLYDLVERIRLAVPELIPDCEVLGDPIDRVPHIVTFSCLDVDGEALLTSLDRAGFAVSSGSACTSEALTPSHVLIAMGALSSGNIRVSIHPRITETDVDRFLSVLPDVVAEVRSQMPATASQPLSVRDTPGRSENDPGIDIAAEEVAAHVVVDSRGRLCPLPILDLGSAIVGIPVGGKLTVLADDPAASNDIAAWARMRRHELISVVPSGDGTTAYLVRRLH
jgi:cysteine desulfurase